jgi:heptosyltransferase II
MPQPAFSNILIRVPNWLGDTMMATPAVGAVKAAFPKTKVSILAKTVFQDFWKAFPGVDQVFSVEKGLGGFWRTASEIRKQEFDAALMLPTSFSSAFLFFAAEIPVRIGWGGEGRDLFLTHVVPHPEPRQRHLVWEYLELVREGFERPLKPHRFRLASPLPAEAREGSRRLFKMAGVKDKQGLVAFSPGATYGPAKRWPLPYWRELVQRLLKERGESILVLGGLEEEKYLQGLAEGFSSQQRGRLHWLVGKTTPLILASILSRCKVLVTNDTGPMHVAAAVGTPTVALFGSTSPAWTRPFGIGHEVIYHRVECSPCFQKSCPIGYICLHGISVNEVFQKVQKKLQKPHKIEGEKPPSGILK